MSVADQTGWVHEALLPYADDQPAPPSRLCPRALPALLLGAHLGHSEILSYQLFVLSCIIIVSFSAGIVPIRVRVGNRTCLAFLRPVCCHCFALYSFVVVC